MVNSVSHRKYLPHGTFNGVDPEVKTLWFRRDVEPELLSGEPTPDEPDDSDPMRGKDAKALLDKLLQKCTPRQASVLVMHHIHGMTLEEIGQVFGVQRERIRQIEYHAMRNVRWKTISDKDVRAFFR
jgi:RNA polymerase sigma factor (sigma-70 family)